MDRELMWVEKYRPKAVEDLVLTTEHRRLIKQFIKDGRIPHLLLVGQVGSGKTTVARILIDNLDCVVRELNASDERGIDTVRNTVKGFLGSQTFKKWKVCFMDEFDATTSDSQFALRNVMEKYSEHGRFILTANYAEKIIEPIRSRCQTLEFVALPKKDVFNRAVFVLKSEGIHYEVADVLKLVEDHYPDVRRVINNAQMCSEGGTLVYKTSVDVAAQVVEFLKKRQLKEIRELVMTHRPDYTGLYRALFDAIPELGGSKIEKGIAVGEYMYRDSIVADREVNFACLCLKLMKG